MGADALRFALAALNTAGRIRLSIERVEIAPAGASALFGNFALGGVVDIVSRPIAGRSIEILNRSLHRSRGAAGISPMSLQDLSQFGVTAGR